MAGWDKENRCKIVRKVEHDTVRSYTEFEFNVMKFDGWNYKTADCDKTFVINCGYCDGENIDLFDLQDWFDENRDWINSLREEVK